MKNKNFLHSVLFTCVLLLGSALVAPQSAKADSYVGTNIVSAASPGTAFLLLSTGGEKISQVQVMAGSGGPLIIDVFDTQYGTTNYTNSAYVTTTQYSTNLITTNISLLNGSTNIFTNVGVFTLTITNAASTNNALPYQTFYASPNTVATYPVSLVNVRGLTIRATGTNGAVNFRYTR